jgi:ribosomal protein S13
MAELSENSKFNISLKTLGGISALITTLVSMWFALQADIAEAKELPKPEINRVEYDLKDEAVRNAIYETQNDVQDIKSQLDKIDERLYEMYK